MNREIIFRGKTEQGEWVYGSLTMAGTEKAWILKAPCTLSMAGREIRTDFDVVKVIPSTIGQYTGLTDKNGTKIFEGDVIKHGYFNKYCREILTAKYIVKWGKCGFGISLACITEQDVCEIIGNIHEEVQE